MGALTEEQKRAYLEHWGCHCPFCGSQDLTVGDIDPDSLGDGGYRQFMHCDSCGKKWQDCYELVDVQEVDEDEETTDQEIVLDVVDANVPSQDEARRLLAEETSKPDVDKTVVGRLVCAKCGGSNVQAVIEERTYHNPPETAAWLVDADGDVQYDEAVCLAEQKGCKDSTDSTDTTETGFSCRDCDSESVKVVPCDA